jgi:flavin reductase (DIM6/NTAB) family NADH-FMN oxidoreductase RutF
LVDGVNRNDEQCYNTPHNVSRRKSVDFDARIFRQAMSQFASGVTIVSTNHEGILHGLTVASFCSLSLDPPLIVVCIDKRSNTHGMIEKSGVFAVNILNNEQQDVSRIFADPSTEGHRFEAVRYRTAASGAPIIEPVLAAIDCKVSATHDGGDHTIFIGEVIDLAIDESAEPLVYWRSGYHDLGHS